MFGLFKRQPVRPHVPTDAEVYRQRVELALEDGVLTEEERDSLKKAADRYGLKDAEAQTIYDSVANGIIEKRALEALEDGQFSPGELKDLQRLAHTLRVEPSFGPQLSAQIDRAQRLWMVINSDLPVVPSPLGLQSGEVAHMWVTAEAFEDRQRTKAVSFAGPVISIPIMKGVRYRMGRYNVGRETYQYQHSFGVGTLVVTNKRLLFVGDRSLTVRLPNVLDVQGYSDGVKVTKTTGKPQTFVYGEGNRDFGIVLARAWTEARQ